MISKMFGGKALWLAALFLTLAPLPGNANGKPTVGDEDPFPLLCVDFSGRWRSDSGLRYDISQHACSWLKIDMYLGNEAASLTIVPDNRERLDGKGVTIRHRWNSVQNGTMIETHRSLLESGLRVTEVVTFERANADLLLQTTYKTIERADRPGEPNHTVKQEVFRRVNLMKNTPNQN